MASANLFQQYLQPVRSVQDYAADMDKAEANQLALQGQRRQNEIAALTADQTRQTMASSAEDRNALQRLAATWGADTSIDQRVASLRNSGRPALMQQADALEKQGLEKQKTGAEVSAKNADAIASAIKNSRTWLDGISTPEQYIAWHEANHRDPALGPYLEARGITADQARANIEQALKTPGGFERMLMESKLGAEKAYDNLLKEAQQAEVARHNKSSEGIQVRGQNMVDARAKEGNSLKAVEIQAGGKPPPGYRWKGDGTLEAIPGGPGDKLPESQQKQVVGTQNLSNAIREYREALKTFGTLDAVKPDQRAMMGTKYNNMMLQAKEAYNLGVLNGPDFDILQSIVTDPRSIKGVITSNNALDTQAAELDRIMSGVAQTSSQLKPRGGAAQTSGQAPKAGTIEEGHRFKGGDPSNPSNWEKVK